MSRNLSARIKALESTQADDGNVGGVIQLLCGETVDEALARAAKEGRSGNFLIVPPILTEEDWVKAAREYHLQQVHQQKFASAGELAAVRCAAVAPDVRDQRGCE